MEKRGAALNAVTVVHIGLYELNCDIGLIDVNQS